MQPLIYKSDCLHVKNLTSWLLMLNCAFNYICDTSSTRFFEAFWRLINTEHCKWWLNSKKATRSYPLCVILVFLLFCSDVSWLAVAMTSAPCEHITKEKSGGFTCATKFFRRNLRKALGIFRLESSCIISKIHYKKYFWNQAFLSWDVKSAWTLVTSEHFVSKV